MSGYTPLPVKAKKKHSNSNNSFITNFLNNGFRTVGDVIGQTDNNALAEAIERQAANQAAQAKAKAAASGGGMGLDPFSALQQQLFNSVNSINVAPTPIEQLRKLAEQQVGAQYDPQIDALSNEMSIHTRRADRSAKSARDMYGALAKDYLSQLPDITAQYKAEDDATNQRYDQAQQQMGAEYSKNADAQDAVLKQLGIQAAAPDASQQAKDDQAYFQNQSNLEQNTALDALAQQQMAQTDYTRNLSGNARMAGENTAQDIQTQLGDYLDQAEGQRHALTASKSSAIAALIAQMQQQDAQRVQTQGQQQFDNMMKLFGFQLDAQNAAVAAAKAMSAAGGGGFGSGSGLNGITTGLQGASNYLASQYPGQDILTSNLMDHIQDVLSRSDVQKGKYQIQPDDPNTLANDPKYADVTPDYLTGLLRQTFKGQENRYGPKDINSAIDALLAYYGKLR